MRNLLFWAFIGGGIIVLLTPPNASTTDPTNTDNIVIRHNTTVTTAVPSDLQQTAEKMLQDADVIPATSTDVLPPLVIPTPESATVTLPNNWQDITPAAEFEQVFEDLWGGKFGDEEFITNFIAGFEATSNITLSQAQRLHVRQEILPRMKTAIQAQFLQRIGNTSAAASAETTVIESAISVMQRYSSEIAAAVLTSNISYH